MLTIFAVPKPFRGHTEVIQRNAITSWTKLRPACEVVLLGDDHGTAEVARELSCRHVAELGRTDLGAPRVDLAFGIAEREAKGSTLAYVNADIVLLDDFPAAIASVAAARERFLMLGRRWDVDLREPLGFAPGWQAELRARARNRGRRREAFAIDYFVFRRGTWPSIPAFALGRCFWDNWLVFSARQTGVAVVDASDRVMAIHQDHDFSHLPSGAREGFKGPETIRNYQLVGGWDPCCFGIDDATHVLGAGGLSRLQAFLGAGRLKRMLLRAASNVDALEPLVGALARRRPSW